MTTTTCACDVTADLLCDFCASNLWAARIEERLGVLEYESDHDERLTEGDVERMIESAITDLPDVADEVERAMPDLDDYVQRSDLQSEIEDALEEHDIVKDAAAGAAEAAMRLHRFATKVDLAEAVSKVYLDVQQRLDADAPKRLDVFAGLSRWQRLRLVFGF